MESGKIELHSWDREWREIEGDKRLFRDDGRWYRERFNFWSTGIIIAGVICEEFYNLCFFLNDPHNNMHHAEVIGIGNHCILTCVSCTELF